MTTLAVGLIVVGCVAGASALLAPPPANSAAPGIELSTLGEKGFVRAAHPVRDGSRERDVLLVRSGGRPIALELPAAATPLGPFVAGADGGLIQWPCEELRVQPSAPEALVQCLQGGRPIAVWAGGGQSKTGAPPLTVVRGHVEDGVFLLY